MILCATIQAAGFTPSGEYNQLVTFTSADNSGRFLSVSSYTSDGPIFSKDSNIFIKDSWIELDGLPGVVISGAALFQIERDPVSPRAYWVLSSAERPYNVGSVLPAAGYATGNPLYIYPDLSSLYLRVDTRNIQTPYLAANALVLRIYIDVEGAIVGNV